ncbi:RsmG family class I SAM-dependent methyltransferase [Pseudodesulfovibrio sp. zrk46]|uniref:16S rRNA (guanine(527)-N(7))-methyltransferase RsmG n=1 Tax=Pseudodesulfovibrio sp. zrk46 TaxID=2725288 RepID=UPI0014498FBC|nr:RsmG family class I SAM-dependent methyltransferase [Pseudodesulfovibrio sp. zrk46]QJB56399.1 16S rRNA (guanine(527)-N(7))-methyltransferase RsmG [Pseudodesulfovibrio sp. zrk46]
MPQTKPTSQEVIKVANELGRPVSATEADSLAGYLDQLIKWNKKMNLVGPSHWRDVFETLMVDSLYLADFLSGLKLNDAPLSLDLGAGAGLPGIPLRALWHDGSYWLVEVREKRSLFMRSVLGRLKLADTNVFHGKAEDALDRLAESGNAATADLILSKAFMPWPKLLDFVTPMLHPTGVLVILSNDPAPNEDELPEGWTLGDVAAYPAAGKEHYFWSLRKN